MSLASGKLSHVDTDLTPFVVDEHLQYNLIFFAFEAENYELIKYCHEKHDIREHLIKNREYYSRRLNYVKDKVGLDLFNEIIEDRQKLKETSETLFVD